MCLETIDLFPSNSTACEYDIQDLLKEYNKSQQHKIHIVQPAINNFLAFKRTDRKNNGEKSQSIKIGSEITQMIDVAIINILRKIEKSEHNEDRNGNFKEYNETVRD